jgi:hypothetical protein
MRKLWIFLRNLYDFAHPLSAEPPIYPHNISSEGAKAAGMLRERSRRTVILGPHLAARLLRRHKSSLHSAKGSL